MNAVALALSNFPYKLVLASASPRRQELLKSLGFNFSIEPVNSDERFSETLREQEIPLYLAKKKALEFPRVLHENELIITSDTIVWCNNQVLNKPQNFEEGKKMLQMLSGNMHYVYTAVCLRSNKKEKLFYDVSKVFFKKLRDAEIEYYLETCRPYDKAGAYGVQDWMGYTGIEKIEGSFYTVMGLPVKLLYEELMSF